MREPYDWRLDPPDPSLEGEEVPPTVAFIAGLASFSVSTFLYSLVTYFVIFVLHDASIIGGRPSWTQTCLMVTGLMFARIWDRALLKR